MSLFHTLQYSSRGRDTYPALVSFTLALGMYSTNTKLFKDSHSVILHDLYLLGARHSGGH